MNMNTTMLKDPRASFFGNRKKVEKMDSNTFKEWKSELQKELPSFWESVSETKRKL